MGCGGRGEVGGGGGGGGGVLTTAHTCGLRNVFVVFWLLGPI